MSQAYVQLATDGAGKRVQAYENSIGGNTVEAQAISVHDSSGWTNSYVAITESTGKKIQYFENTVGGNVVQAIAVVLVNTSGASI